MDRSPQPLVPTNIFAMGEMKTSPDNQRSSSDNTPLSLLECNWKIKQQHNSKGTIHTKTKEPIKSSASGSFGINNNNLYSLVESKQGIEVVGAENNSSSSSAKPIKTKKHQDFLVSPKKKTKIQNALCFGQAAFQGSKGGDHFVSLDTEQEVRFIYDVIRFIYDLNCEFYRENEKC